MKFGDYEVEAELGRGACGVVYRARHRATGALRAVKVLESIPHPEELARFEREAQALARIGGEGTVPVHEAGSERGRPFLVLGLMSGGSLEKRLAAAGRIEWREALAIAITLARALERCHAAGIVHRDLKPANILFDDESRPRLADFGMVRDLHAASLTESGTTLGTPMYMPPEQLAGTRVDGRADVYALGAVLHELVTGERPFRATSSLVALQEEKGLGQRPRLDVPGVPAALDRLLDRALAPDVERRTASAGALRLELEAVLAGKAPDPGGPWRAPLAAGLAAVGLVLTVAAASLHGRPATPPKPPAPTSPGASPGVTPRASLAPGESDRTRRERLQADVDRELREGSYVDAIATCVSAFEKAPDPWVRALEAECRVEAGDFEAALKIVEDWPVSAERTPERPGEARALSVRAFIRERRRDPRAAADAERALALDNRLARAYVVRSQQALLRARALDASDHDGTLESLRAAVAAATSAERLAPPCAAHARFILAEASSSLQSHDQFDKSKSKTREDEPESFRDRDFFLEREVPNPKTPVRTTLEPELAFLRSAWLKLELDQPEEALKLAEQAAALNPYRASTDSLLARTLTLLHRPPEVWRPRLKEALERDSLDRLANELLVFDAVHSNDPVNALAAANRLVQGSSQTAFKKARVGILALSGDWATAAKAFAECGELMQDRGLLFAQGALFALRAGDLPTAASFADRAVAMHPRFADEPKDEAAHVAFPIVQARVLFEMNKLEEALAVLGSADPDHQRPGAIGTATARVKLRAHDPSGAARALAIAIHADQPFRSACESAKIDVTRLDSNDATPSELEAILTRALDLPLAPDTELLRTVLVENWPLIEPLPPLR